MSSVLTDTELAELLKLDMALTERLIAETDLPRVAIAGQLRFVTGDILTWLSTQTALLIDDEGSDAEVATDTDPDAVPFSEAETVMLPAEEDEAPFVSRTALLSLGSGAADPGQNLARQQVRDGLAALGDAVHPALVRLSQDRLHPAPSEAERTSPWRIDASTGPIHQVSMTWAEGSGPPGFPDRPHLALTVTGDAIEFSVKAPSGDRPSTALTGRARASGAMVSIDSGDGPWSVTYLYEVARGAPTAAALQAQLTRDAKALVPLWLAAAGQGADA